MGRMLCMLAAVVLGSVACAQEWCADVPPMRSGASSTLVFDEVRGRVLSFGVVDTPSFESWRMWSYDGAEWRLLPVPGEEDVIGCRHAVYDSARDRVVAVVQQGLQWLTFEFDGNAWSEYVPPTPTPRPDALVYDVARQVTVMVRGLGPECQTWEYDGVDWTLRVPFPRPPTRQRMELGYDRVRQRVVMYGGYPGFTNSSRFLETWEYDGAGWQQIGTSLTPPDQGPMCFDEVSGRLLMAATVTWSYDGTGWSSTQSFGAVTDLTYDRLRNVPVGIGRRSVPGGLVTNVAEYVQGQWVVRFAQPSVSSPTMFADGVAGRVLMCGSGVWERRDGVWSRITTASRGFRSQRTFDASRGRILALEPHDPFTNNLWQWLPSGWSVIANSPTSGAGQGPPSEAMLAYDVGRDRLVAFGGRVFGIPSNVTYEWDGAQWAPVSTAGPSARRDASMVYSHALGGIVLFGGTDASVTPLTDTWLYSDGVWSQIVTPHTPGGRTRHALCEDRARGVVVLRGGNSQNASSRFDDTWQFDGVDWTELGVDGPEQGGDAACAVDPVTGALVTVGGQLGGLNTFVLKRPGEPLATRYGTGCPGSSGAAELLDTGALPQPSATIEATISNLPGPGLGFVWFGFDIDQWAGARLPFELGAFGLPGCRMWAAPEPGLAYPLVGTAGVASVQVALPTSAALAGQSFAAQALVADPLTPAGAITSNALLWTIW